MWGETMKDKSKKSTYSTTFGVDPITKAPALFAKKNAAKTASISGAP